MCRAVSWSRTELVHPRFCLLFAGGAGQGVKTCQSPRRLSAPAMGRVGIGLNASSVSLWSEWKVEVRLSLPSAGGHCPWATVCLVSAVALFGQERVQNTEFSERGLVLNFV